MRQTCDSSSRLLSRWWRRVIANAIMSKCICWLEPVAGHPCAIYSDYVFGFFVLHSGFEGFMDWVYSVQRAPDPTSRIISYDFRWFHIPVLKGAGPISRVTSFAIRFTCGFCWKGSGPISRVTSHAIQGTCSFCWNESELARSDHLTFASFCWQTFLLLSKLLLFRVWFW